MSNAIQTAVLLDAIRSAIVAAWPAMAISYGAPRTPVAAPYAVVSADSVAVSFTGVSASLLGTSQENRFSIVGRFPFPSDATSIIELQKVSYANELIAQLQSGGSFASIGMFPLVKGIDFSESDDPNERVFEVTLLFSVITMATHH